MSQHSGVPTGSGAPRLRFGAFVLDLRRAELARSGQPVALRPKALALLALLATRAGEAVTKDELLAGVWPGVVVTEDSLTQCVAELRTVLGDRGGQSIIRTLPRLGYRFDVPVQAVPDEEAAAVIVGGAAPTSPTSPAAQTPPAPLPGDATAPAGAPAVSPPRRGPALPWRRGAVFVLSLAALAGATAWVQTWRGSAPPIGRIDAELAARRSVAVMPFTDLSQPPAPHLAEGVVEEILTDVARMRDTLVIAGGTTRALAARGLADPVQVGRQLGVQFVLGGSLRQEGERLLINVQLARAEGGSVLWSERYEVADAAPWTWRRDVSGRIAGTLDVKMLDMALDPAANAGRSSQAMEQWMRGAYLLRHYKKRDEVLRARAHFEAALAVEPRSVSALIGLARTHHAEVLRRWLTGTDKASALARAKDHALAALAIEPNHPGAVATLGVVLSFANDFEAAERALARALELNPNNAEAHRDLGGLKYLMGRFDEVQQHIATALRLNPLEVVHVWQCHMILGDSLMHLGRDGAREQHQLAALAEPTLPNPHFSMASDAAQRGQLEVARTHLDLARRMAPTAAWSIARSRAADRSSHPAYLVARERYRDGLRLAGLPEGTVDDGTAPADAAPAERRPPAGARGNGPVNQTR